MLTKDEDRHRLLKYVDMRLPGPVGIGQKTAAGGALVSVLYLAASRSPWATSARTALTLSP